MMILASAQQKEEIKKDIERLVKRVRKKTCKERVKKITDLDKMLHRSIITKGTSKYFTTGHNVQARDLCKEGSPYSEEFKPAKKLHAKSYMAPTEIWESRNGIPERLRVETPPLDEGVKDTIPEFYRLTSCRPIRERFNKYEFSQQMRARFLNNLQSGLFMDIIRRIDEHDQIARSVVQKAVDDSDEAVWGFKLFLSNQIKDIRSIEEEFKTVVALRKEKEKSIDLALRKLGDIKVEMFNKMEKISEAMKCKEFLHNLSSKQWLYEYGIQTQERKKENKTKVDELKSQFENFKRHLGGKDQGLEDIISEYINLFENSGPVDIPFKNSYELSLALKQLEMSNKDMLMHIKQLRKPVKDANDYLKEVENHHKRERENVEGKIKRVDSELIKIRARLDMMACIMHDMQKKFKKSVASKEVLQNRGLLKSLYDEIVDNPISNPTPTQMWKGIEEAMLVLTDKLEQLPRKEVQRRKEIILARLEKERSAAEKAKNHVMQVEQMLKGLQKSYEMPKKTFGKALMPRSEPPPAPLRTPTPESPIGFGYSPELELEHKMYSPLAVKNELPRISPAETPESDIITSLEPFLMKKELESPSEEVQRREIEEIVEAIEERESPLDDEEILFKHERLPFEEAESDVESVDYSKFVTEEENDEEDVREPFFPTPEPLKLEMPEYVPLVEEEEVVKEEEDSDDDYR